MIRLMKMKNQKASNYKIYLHRNAINGKVYVGMTKEKLSRRFRNGDGYKRCTYFYRAISKYGWDSFETEVLYKDLNFDDACQMERAMIQKYKSTDKACGYNTMYGGMNQDGIPEEARKKISASLTGKKASPEARRKMSESHKGKMLGEKNPMYGKGMPGESNPMYNMRRGKCPCSKKVIGNGVFFNCVADCADYFGIGYSSMRAYLNGQRKMPQALIDAGLKYVSDFNKGVAS